MYAENSFVRYELCTIIIEYTLEKKHLHVANALINSVIELESWHHMKIHTGEKPFNCNECSEQFSTAGVLHRHMRMRIYTGKELAPCNYLHRHIKINKGEKPFTCYTCNMQFITREYTQEKPFTCSECTKPSHENSHWRK